MSRPRVRVGILGATGAVGQKLVLLLRDHPWFSLTALAASKRSAGKTYGEAVHWLEPEPMPAGASGLILQPADPPLECDLVFSALDADVARVAEPAFAVAGYPVVSNASAHRMEPQVPLLVPEVNPDHVALVRRQGGGPGFIVTNPNCVTAGLVLCLKPLDDCFGVEGVDVTTLQAVSGAGYPGVPALDILGNVIPHIAGEEEKVAREPGKILGRLRRGRVVLSSVRISAQATRVPVLDGHLLSVSLSLRRRARLDEVRDAFRGFAPPPRVAALPSVPRRPLVVLEDETAPQPRLHVGTGNGMTVSIGRLRACAVMDWRFVALVHNTVRGAAGAALLNAELLVAEGLVPARGYATARAASRTNRRRRGSATRDLAAS
jgi:aspartate-semialdehyde dehydrogenase